MEGVTWLTHKYIMHGLLWRLHKDHHQPQPGFFEKNDSFFLIFAVPSWLSIALYGLAYFLVHDVIIHQRFKWFSRSNNRYIKSIRLAHKMHHKHLGRLHGESFGLLWVAKKYRVKKQPLPLS